MSSPLSMKRPAWVPSGVPISTARRSSSPLAMCGMASRSASRRAWVPFPAPGAPRSTTRGTGPSLARFAWLSIGAACVTIGLKAGAYTVTGSVGLLADALESIVNLVVAIVALVALTIAAREPHG
jgi:hypothetical protein